MPIGTIEKNEYWLMIRLSRDGGSMTSMLSIPMSLSYCSRVSHASSSIFNEKTVVEYFSMIL